MSSDDHQLGVVFFSDEPIGSDDGSVSFASEDNTGSGIPIGTSGRSLEGEEEDEEEEEEIEDDDRRMDDSERERHARQVYEDTHPGPAQIARGSREIGEHEALWFVSTFRPDWGVEKMRDNDPLTYWQSDCPNPKSPHTIDLCFRQATFISQVSFFIDYFQDESYTPKRISIRGGTTYRDLQEITVIECGEGVRWHNADLISIIGEPVRLWQLQIAIVNTHLNGRDTHIRQLKVYSVLPSHATKKAGATNFTNKGLR